MSNETIVTIIGNLTSDPELRYTQNGLAVANFTIASTPRKFDKQKNEWIDEEALFMRSSVWREAAEQVASSLTKGTRVIAQGRLKQRSFEKDGQKRTVIELEVDEIGPSLKYASAQVTRTGQGGSSQARTATNTPAPEPAYPQPAANAQGDVWGAPDTTYPAAESLPF